MLTMFLDIIYVNITVHVFLLLWNALIGRGVEWFVNFEAVRPSSILWLQWRRLGQRRGDRSDRPTTVPILMALFLSTWLSILISLYIIVK